jgi:hypothetical protein
MRDPAPRVDPEIEAVIEETRRFLEGYVKDESWKADADVFACDNRAAIDEVEASNLPDWAKNFAVYALFQQTKKRPRKPTRHYRNSALEKAAARLVSLGYKPTRNEATRRDSASSIIAEALRRLHMKPSEKQINAIVRNAGDLARDAARIRDELGYDVLK